MLEVNTVEWAASRTSPTVLRPEYYVIRTSDGDRYVLTPLDEPVLDVRWRGIALRAR